SATCVRTSISRRESDELMPYSCADTGRNNGFRFCRFRTTAAVTGIHCADEAERRTRRNQEDPIEKPRPVRPLVTLLFLVGLIGGGSAGHSAAATATTFSGQ